MSERNCYEILGGDADASEREIRRAFRRLALRYHPDRNADLGAEGRFREAYGAYEAALGRGPGAPVEGGPRAAKCDMCMGSGDILSRWTTTDGGEALRCPRCFGSGVFDPHPSHSRKHTSLNCTCPGCNRQWDEWRRRTRRPGVGASLGARAAHDIDVAVVSAIAAALVERDAARGEAQAERDRGAAAQAASDRRAAAAEATQAERDAAADAEAERERERGQRRARVAERDAARERRRGASDAARERRRAEDEAARERRRGGGGASSGAKGADPPPRPARTGVWAWLGIASLSLLAGAALYVMLVGPEAAWAAWVTVTESVWGDLK